MRDVGNVLRLRVVTMEAEPRLIEVTGGDLHRVNHAYGTNGIIVEVEIPFALAYDWTGLFLAFDDFATALGFASNANPKRVVGTSKKLP